MAYASWYHWNCGLTQRKAATINQLACSSYSLYVQLLWYPMYYPGGMKARVSPVQWSKPHSILAPTQDSNPGGRIQSHKRWPLHYHCPHIFFSSSCYLGYRVITAKVLVSFKARTEESNSIEQQEQVKHIINKTVNLIDYFSTLLYIQFIYNITYNLYFKWGNSWRFENKLKYISEWNLYQDVLQKMATIKILVN